MKPLFLTTLMLSILFTGCTQDDSSKVQIDRKAYEVNEAKDLQERFNQLNIKLAADFKHFKQVENIAFSQQYPLDTNDLKTLNMHLVASTALKPTKVAYCNLMNDYFTEMYRLGHFNLKLMNEVKLPHAEQENLEQDFASADQFYDFILNRYTTYRQVQEVMMYGCNLKGELNAQ